MVSGVLPSVLYASSPRRAMKWQLLQYPACWRTRMAMSGKLRSVLDRSLPIIKNDSAIAAVAA